jgi:hypothetical protein
MKKKQTTPIRKVILTLLVLALTGCTSPSSNPSTFIKAPVLWGHAAKGTTSRSLIVNDSNDATQVLGSDTMVPFSLSPVVTAWASSPVSGNTLSYTVFGQAVNVQVGQNTDGSTTFTSTIQGTNGSGLADDHNTCVFTITLKPDNSFTYEQAIWLRSDTAAFAPDVNAGDYLNEYLHATGSGKVSNASGDFTASGSEYKVDNLFDASGSHPVWPKVHGITFEAKSVGGNIAVLTDTDYSLTTNLINPSAAANPPNWPVGQTGADAAFETTYPAPSASTSGVSSDQICGWYFVSANGMRTYIQNNYSGAAGYNSVGLGWGVITSNLSSPNVTGITSTSAQTVYGQPF